MNSADTFRRVGPLPVSVPDRDGVLPTPSRPFFCMVLFLWRLSAHTYCAACRIFLKAQLLHRCESSKGTSQIPARARWKAAFVA